MSKNFNPVQTSETPLDTPGHASCETYATMINRNIIIPSNAAGYFSVEQYFFFDLMEKILSEIQVDEDWYLAKHPDIRDAIKRGTVQSGQNHYVRFGFYEHRLPYAIEVSEKWYIDAYSDVKEAIQRGIYKSGQSHFELAGFREGRMPHPNFTLRSHGG